MSPEATSIQALEELTKALRSTYHRRRKLRPQDLPERSNAKLALKGALVASRDPAHKTEALKAMREYREVAIEADRKFYASDLEPEFKAAAYSLRDDATEAWSDRLVNEEEAWKLVWADDFKAADALKQKAEPAPKRVRWTLQKLQTSNIHKGYDEEEIWVYKDSGWGYVERTGSVTHVRSGCATGPGAPFRYKKWTRRQRDTFCKEVVKALAALEIGHEDRMVIQENQERVLQAIAAGRAKAHEKMQNWS